MKKTLTLIVSLLFVFGAIAQSFQKGPYTVTTLAAGVYHIEDGNDSNPAGVHVDATGKTTGQNNCSDMYLIVGKDKALLIDLSNFIKWDATAVESLRSIVYEKAENRQLVITVTHNHGDHLGMLPAFAEDAKATFWLSKAEFEAVANKFPADRTSFVDENASIDLGGNCIVNTIEMPGHTAHSILFFLKDQNIVFTGDAIGSGSGVWLFNYDSFMLYTKSIDKLISYLNDKSNHIDTQKLIIYGGHFWQKGKVEKLTAQYIFDMKTLIGKMGKGTADVETVSNFIPFLNGNFKYGTATITWNKEAAAKYAESMK